MMVELLENDLTQFPFLYENKKFLPIEDLQEGGKKHVVPIVRQLLLHLGIERFQDLVLELKWEKKKEEE